MNAGGTKQSMEEGSVAETEVVVEELEFHVPGEEVDRFVRADELVWTKYLRSCPGFLRKQVWVKRRGARETGIDEKAASHDDEAESVAIRAVVWWKSMSMWHAIPHAELEEIERKFEEELGGKKYPIVTSAAYKLSRDHVRSDAGKEENRGEKGRRGATDARSLAEASVVQNC